MTIYSIKAQRGMHQCAKTCPFTTGVRCEETAPVSSIPRRLKHLVPKGIEMICAGCYPKLEDADEREQAELRAEKQDKAKARREAKAAKRSKREAANQAQNDLAEAVQALEDIHKRRAAFEEEQEGAYQAFVQRRRDALQRVREAESGLRRAERELSDAHANLSQIAKAGPYAGLDAPQEADVEAARARVTAAGDAARAAWKRTTKSHRNRRMDRALFKRAACLTEPEGEV